mmetsp:Transcript_115194/g.358735  ORF Transcript_115194/g.358735 Transcript_115194/m.358735 type:complete len:227 (+) Transcript_115194:264-944(+)
MASARTSGPICGWRSETPAKGDDVLLGVAELHLSKASAGTVTLNLAGARNNNRVVGPDGQPAEVIVSVSYSACPSPSRLSGLWRVQVDRARHMPLHKPHATSSATPGSTNSMFVAVLAQEQTSLGNRRISQRTRSVPSAPDPAWGEEFEFPVAQAGGPGVGELCEALGYQAGEDAVDSLAKHLPPPVSLGAASSKSGEDAVRLVALGQMAFMTELRESWSKNSGAC